MFLLWLPINGMRNGVGQFLATRGYAKSSVPAWVQNWIQFALHLDICPYIAMNPARESRG